MAPPGGGDRQGDCSAVSAGRGSGHPEGSAPQGGWAPPQRPLQATLCPALLRAQPAPGSCSRSASRTSHTPGPAARDPPPACACACARLRWPPTPGPPGCGRSLEPRLELGGRHQEVPVTEREPPWSACAHGGSLRRCAPPGGRFPGRTGLCEEVQPDSGPGVPAVSPGNPLRQTSAGILKGPESRG